MPKLPSHSLILGGLAVMVVVLFGVVVTLTLRRGSGYAGTTHTRPTPGADAVKLAYDP